MGLLRLLRLGLFLLRLLLRGLNGLLLSLLFLLFSLRDVLLTLIQFGLFLLKILLGLLLLALLLVKLLLQRIEITYPLGEIIKLRLDALVFRLFADELLLKISILRCSRRIHGCLPHSKPYDEYRDERQHLEYPTSPSPFLGAARSSAAATGAFSGTGTAIPRRRGRRLTCIRSRG
ncbi:MULTISPECIES: hypothetical protein [unclassified Bifidobacterium]|uniref:hypothetical protein n=1 Tax=unclassified Bifidobacterium TaxID=2608897 RepID=UPI0021596379|nr:MULTISPECIES: hypothetical protein [unclassified Bifidobacterium]